MQQKVQNFDLFISNVKTKVVNVADICLLIFLWINNEILIEIAVNGLSID